eukprot:TRINITY_DN6729_c0_g1_i1.p1 TRINITY_DN6729_c0_g1~~TRINITY_DN6729_c0_g1_i1.p1  ORF type:complete len:714 (+),score=72.36 TRINITY_DN6729_c0_g1_i1:53-2194(+)
MESDSDWESEIVSTYEGDSRDDDSECSGVSLPSEYGNHGWRFLGGDDFRCPTHTLPNEGSPRSQDISDGTVVEATRVSDGWLKIQKDYSYCYAKVQHHQYGFLPSSSCRFLGYWQHISPDYKVITFHVSCSGSVVYWDEPGSDHPSYVLHRLCGRTYTYASDCDYSKVELSYKNGNTLVYNIQHEDEDAICGEAVRVAFTPVAFRSGCELDSRAAGICGLSNLGNTCYMNSVLQCVLSCKGFQGVLISNWGSSKSLAASLCEVLQKITSGSGQPFQPGLFRSFLCASDVRFADSSQHDSHEFYISLLSLLEQEGVPATPFKLSMRSTLRCNKCQFTSSKEEPSLSVSVPCQIDFLSRPVLTVKYLPYDVHLPAELIPVKVSSQSDILTVQEMLFETKSIILRENCKLTVCEDKKGPASEWRDQVICVAEIPQGAGHAPVFLQNSKTHLFEMVVLVPVAAGRCRESDIFAAVKQYHIPRSSDVGSWANVGISSAVESSNLTNNYITVRIGSDMYFVSEGSSRYIRVPDSSKIIVETSWERSRQKHQLSETASEWSKGQRTNLSKTLTSCLEEYTSSEQLGPGDKWNCPKCNLKVQAWKDTKISESPEYLVIQLSRFLYSGTTRKKLDTPVIIERQLDITPYVTEGNSRTSYSLVGVANHSGSAHFGHCTADVFSNSNLWHLDDESVTLSSFDELNYLYPYLLFYELTSEDVPAS